MIDRIKQALYEWGKDNPGMEDFAEEMIKWLDKHNINNRLMEEYEIIGWPEIQHFMDLEGFDNNATLIEENNSMGIGSSTYLVSKDWLDSLDD